ncbi:MAG: hypothetical protein IPP73_10540 [Chitinophagaceae bacterium]|nr:hypothetical protein [Chitinophagaceae bacterium]
MKSKHISNILYFISPFILWVILCLVCAIIKKASFNGDTTTWAYLAANLFLPSFFILMPAAVLIKYLIKERVLLIWIIETIILLLIWVFAVR